MPNWSVPLIPVIPRDDPARFGKPDLHTPVPFYNVDNLFYQSYQRGNRLPPAGFALGLRPYFITGAKVNAILPQLGGGAGGAPILGSGMTARLISRISAAWRAFDG